MFNEIVRVKFHSYSY